MSFMMREEFAPVEGTRQDQPTPTRWSEQSRGTTETALDAESAVSLSCHLNHVFERAHSWDSLLSDLAERCFALRFEETRLVLVNTSTGRALCTCASLGHAFSGLSGRFGKPRVQAESGDLLRDPAPGCAMFQARRIS